MSHVILVRDAQNEVRGVYTDDPIGESLAVALAERLVVEGRTIISDVIRVPVNEPIPNRNVPLATFNALEIP